MLKAMNPIAAPPLEIGLDPRPMVYLASQLESQETAHRIICAILLVLTVFAFILGMPEATFVLLFLVAAVAVGKRHVDRQAKLRDFARNKFNLDKATQLLNAPHDSKLDVGIGPSDQRVLVFKDFDPFKFAGVPVGKWSFTVDVERPAQTASGTAQVHPVSCGEIEAAIKRELPGSGFGDLLVREIIAIRGEDAFILPMVSHEANINQPNVSLNEVAVADLAERHPNLVRCYIMFHDIRWDGGLILTHVVRTVLQGKIFYIETSRFALTPPTKEFKGTDTTNFNKKPATRIREFFGLAMVSPFVVIAETYNLLRFATLSRSIKQLKKEYLESLETNPMFNYGAADSTRREMMDEKFDHYSQKADLDFSVKAFDQTIVELIYKHMQDHGVDVSDLRNKVMTIYNSGIMVQGGDVTAQTMAVGQGATAQTSQTSSLGGRSHTS
ncbi:hypothetical protein ABIC03_002232 [Bradyrhizobium sp. RT6a]|uniref:hypothetical protein n=1 Tax=unclassified Bradyrhizobium TaxID=2631580 RepID=UPI003391791C